MKEKVIIHMHSRHEYAVAAFQDMEKRVRDYPRVEVRRSDLSIRGQGMVHRFMSGDGTKLRGYDIDMLFFDDVGPFYGQTTLKPKGGTMQKPTVGRIVHYQAYGTPGGEFKSVPRAAIVAEVHSEEEVTVCVLNPMGLFFNKVKYSAEPKPGHWNWPPRE